MLDVVLVMESEPWATMSLAIVGRLVMEEATILIVPSEKQVYSRSQVTVSSACVVVPLWKSCLLSAYVLQTTSNVDLLLLLWRWLPSEVVVEHA